MEEQPEQEFDSFDRPLFTPPSKKLPKHSPLRTIAIDKLEQGEEILPYNFVLIFSDSWVDEEVRGINDIYQRVLPMIGIQGRAVFLHSRYMNSPVEKFLKDLRRIK